MCLFFLIMLFAFPITSAAQNKKGTYNDKQNLKVVLNKEPEFKGGEEALFKFINDSLVYSEDDIKNKLTGEVMIGFDVMPDSSLSNIQIISGVASGIDNQILKLFKNIRFSPSIQNGMALKMNMMISIPVRYRPNIKTTN
jgi:TonB family protein